MSAGGKLKVGLVLTFGEDEVGAEFGATFRDETFDEVGLARGEKALDFGGGDLGVEQGIFKLEDDTVTAVAVRFTHDVGLGGFE